MVLKDVKQMEMVIERDEAQNCCLLVEELDNVRICLSSTEINDIELLFNKVFRWIVENKQLISFYTNDTGNDLYNEVAKELITQLNSEINQAEGDFNSIIGILAESAN